MSDNKISREAKERIEKVRQTDYSHILKGLEEDNLKAKFEYENNVIKQQNNYQTEANKRNRTSSNNYSGSSNNYYNDTTGLSLLVGITALSIAADFDNSGGPCSVDNNSDNFGGSDNSGGFDTSGSF